MSVLSSHPLRIDINVVGLRALNHFGLHLFENDFEFDNIPRYFYLTSILKNFLKRENISYIEKNIFYLLKYQFRY